MPRAINVHSTVSSERGQAWATRQPLLKKLKPLFDGRTVVTLFTSFWYPVQIDDEDCDMLQSVLQQTDVSKGLVLMISSPGGDGVAAERIVNICRAYSGTGEYWALVPGRAKSAGTMVCMGASKIIMAPPSELGPVDPQIIKVEDGVTKYYSADSLVRGYDTLFQEAVKTGGHIEPYIQQLGRYDVRDINSYRNFIALAKDISIKMLESGMMSSKTRAEIENKIKIFLDPGAGTHEHGRPIYSKEAQSCDLNIEEMDVNSPTWKGVYELYIRTERYVSNEAAKTVESDNEAFYSPPPR